MTERRAIGAMMALPLIASFVGTSLSLIALGPPLDSNQGSGVYRGTAHQSRDGAHGRQRSHRRFAQPTGTQITIVGDDEPASTAMRIECTNAYNQQESRTHNVSIL